MFLVKTSQAKDKVSKVQPATVSFFVNMSLVYCHTYLSRCVKLSTSVVTSCECWGSTVVCVRCTVQFCCFAVVQYNFSVRTQRTFEEQENHGKIIKMFLRQLLKFLLCLSLCFDIIRLVAHLGHLKYEGGSLL